MTVTSSATRARFGSNSESVWPLWPCGPKLNFDPESFISPPMKAKRLPASSDSGHFSPSRFANSGFGSNRSSCDGAPIMCR